MSFTPPSKSNAREEAEGSLTTAGREGASSGASPVQILVIGAWRERNTALQPPRVADRVHGDPRFPKRALKNHRGETANVLSSLPIPQLQRRVNTLSPQSANQRVRTLLFLRCLLHTANSADFCCSESRALEGTTVPTSKTWLACRRSQEDQRVFGFFLIPATLPSLCHTHSHEPSD